MGISLPSLSLRDGMVPCCLGASPTEGSKAAVMEFMVAVVILGVGWLFEELNRRGE